MQIEEITNRLAALPAPYFGANLYDEQEIAAAVRVIYNQSPFRHYGRKWTREAVQLEEEAARFYATRHALAVNSGTGALVLSLHALGVGPGDEVIIPAFFWIAAGNAVLLRGAIPVLCEIDSSLNMDPSDLRRKMTAKTKCAIAVHMFGGQADIAAIRRVCDEHGIRLLEDFSQCNGASIEGRYLGFYGDIAITSLQLNKAVTSGEGGLILTRDSDFIVRAAAIMRVQLRKLPAIVEGMRSAAEAVASRIELHAGVEFRRIIDGRGQHGSTVTMIFPAAREAADFTAAGKRLFGEQWRLVHLKDHGQHFYHNCTNLVEKIAVLPGGFPWNLPENRGEYRYAKGSCPVSDSLLERSVGLQLPPI